MKSYRSGIATLALLVAVVAAFQLAPRASHDTAVEAVATAAVAPSATPDPNIFHSDAGFEVTLPRGWSAADRAELFNRRSIRLLVISSGRPPIANEQGIVRTDELPADQVLLELDEFSFPGGPGADTESSFPLDWHAAQAAPDPAGQASMVLRFQYLMQSLSLVAHVGPTASAADRDAVYAVVASLRPEPIPTTGTYRDRWVVVGALASFPVGTVQHFDDPLWKVHGFYLVRGTTTTLAHIDAAYLSMGAFKPCPIRYEASSKTFVCDATGERWTRTGTQIGGAGLFGLSYHAVLVKDGLVLVGGASTGGGGPRPSEADEFSDRSVPPARSAPTKSDVLDRFGRITTASPIMRSAAKLVSRDVALKSDVIRGAVIPPDQDRVWIVAFGGDVRVTGGNELSGRWTLFYVDAVTGGAITMSCCGPGDWPAGFDALPDLSRP